MVTVPLGITASMKSPLLLDIHRALMVPGPVPPHQAAQPQGLYPDPQWHLQALGWAHLVAQVEVQWGSMGLPAPWV